MSDVAESAAQGIANAVCLFGHFESGDGLFKIDVYAVDLVLQHSHSHARDSVRLVKYGGNAHLCGGVADRIAGVSAGAYHKIGLLLAQQLFGLECRAYEKKSGFDIGKGERTSKTLDLDMVKRVACRLDKLVFDSA